MPTLAEMISGLAQGGSNIASVFDTPPSKRRPESASTPMQAPRTNIENLAKMLLDAMERGDVRNQGAEREAQGGIHRDMSGRPIDQIAPAAGQMGSPITFKSADERYAEMAKYPNITAPPRNDYSNPYFAGALPEAPPAPQTTAPQVGSYIPGPMGTFDLVGPKDPLSGGGNILQSGIVPGSETAAPVEPGMQRTPAGNAVPARRASAAPRPRPGQGGFQFGGFR